MDPTKGCLPNCASGLPHPRGDGPARRAATSCRTASPPPAWGWTRLSVDDPHGGHVSPTRVGMDPSPASVAADCTGLPHPRGDGPMTRAAKRTWQGSPPPAWGWTLMQRSTVDDIRVSPTRVGMDPCRAAVSRWCYCLPHPRGDGPRPSPSRKAVSSSPPPAWGWTRTSDRGGGHQSVSPTRVGMDPDKSRCAKSIVCLPHPRGDGPVGETSPRSPVVSPPPAWGWTRADRCGLPTRDVSPTRVGMDPCRRSDPRGIGCLPHPRGDGPGKVTLSSIPIGSPPPAWGWTLRSVPELRVWYVSPTRVGMDPTPSNTETRS